MKRCDIVIIGGGIVGLAAAWKIHQRDPSQSMVVIEKEKQLAQHQTGRNSGVIHSGIYYKPGSLKAKNCREGKRQLEAFCSEHDVDFSVTGKVIVATHESELPALQRIFERGQQNGVNCELVDQPRLLELEPHVAGIKAIHVPESGIVDYTGVCQKLAALLQAAGVEIRTGERVTSIQQSTDQVEVVTDQSSLAASQLVNCGGLFSDRLAKASGQQIEHRIVPFRGEYFVLKPEAEHLCRTLIYPVPDPGFPFLGVHFTRMIEGGVECGPNAVLALSREGYTWKDVNLRDMWDSLTYTGFLRLAFRYWKVGAGEVYRSLSKRAFVKALQKLVPEIKAEHLEVAPAGVRAQALTRSGDMVDDFLLLRQERVLNVCNAPSPAATASLNIGDEITNELF